MGVNWRVEAMWWKPYVDQEGNTHLLNHLHPLRYQVDLPASNGHPAKVVSIEVAFAMHCFTRASESGDAPGQLYQDDREQRAFDHGRYALSKRLPEVARSLPKRHSAFAKAENYVTVDVDAGSGQPAGRYGVFFNLKKQGNDEVLVVIQSAYLLGASQPAPGSGRITFNALLGHVLRGTRPKRP